MKRLKKVGVSLSALILIFLLLGVASTTNNYSAKRTGFQIIEPWTPSPGLFKQISVPLGKAAEFQIPGQPWLDEKNTEEESLTPKNVQYFINGILVPKMSIGEIQLRDDKIRTYEGKFGPYPYNPSQNILIKICAQNKYESDPPTCEQLTSISYIDKYVVFGYANKHDEYIGYYPRRQFTTYFEVYSNDGKLLSKSNVGKVRLTRS